MGYDRQQYLYYFEGNDGERSATAKTLPELAALLAERRPPRRIAVTLSRNSARSVRSVLNMGESVNDFVRLAVVGEVSRRRGEDHEALYGEPSTQMEMFV